MNLFDRFDLENQQLLYRLVIRSVLPHLPERKFHLIDAILNRIKFLVDSLSAKRRSGFVRKLSQAVLVSVYRYSQSVRKNFQKEAEAYDFAVDDINFHARANSI